jgi:hypothetical protein
MKRVSSPSKGDHVVPTLVGIVGLEHIRVGLFYSSKMVMIAQTFHHLKEPGE